MKKYTSRIALFASAAAVANVIIFYIGSAAGASMVAAGPTDQTINIFMVNFATLFPLVVVSFVVWAITKGNAKKLNLWAWVGFWFAIASLAGSILAGKDLATGLSLASMHVVTGFAWLLGSKPKR